ncbi:MAG TPA: FoF1 ATP synthase subunit a [Candidatus Acidoferrales bacterium]|nr:FoF1 ATP synthase subunit a [Candidatus Acidoferrales bacterium]
MGEGQVLGITKLVNLLLGKPVAALLALLHIHPANSEYPIPNHIAMELVVVAFSIVFFLWLKRRMSAESPGATQQCMEFVLSNPMGVGVKDLLDDIVGCGSEKHLALLGSISIFILFSNLIGLVPGFTAPTADKSIPLGCATVVFIYYNLQGIHHHGPAGYGKTLMGPVKWIAWLIAPIETISHFARVLSLTVRLWANMMVGELLYGSFLGLSVALFIYLGRLNPVGYVAAVVPVGIPLLLIGFHVFEAFLQAFIFTILPAVYLGFAVSEEH